MPIAVPATTLYKETLLRIEQNDITCTRLSIGERFNLKDEFPRLGNSIGTNTHLITREGERLGLDVTHREFFEGLTKNNSINTVELFCNQHHGGIVHEILKSYQTNSNNLVDLFIDSINLQMGGEHVLAATLQSCTNLTKLSLRRGNIYDERLFTLVNAIRGNHSLEVLNLEENTIGDAGCEALSTLLTNPQSNLQYLGLNYNDIGTDGAIAILNALEGNNRLRELSLFNRNLMDMIVVKDALSRLLCNTSSINSTYSSNHTVFPQLNTGGELLVLIKMNSVTNKSHVAIRKILRHHPKIDMKQFFGWDAEGEWTLKGLPYVLAWLEKARGAAIVNEEGYEDDTDGEEECSVEKRKLLAIYEFAKAMPLRFVPASSIKVGDKKRKSVGK